ncbi:MAG: hypothetical protein ACKVJ2_14935 [Pseudomonadales bacterium]|jgi:hypothetical protein|tara:strand:- start:151 stop:321 length:171 start_codon:yes stop_codon:yes gene_type:complete
MINSSPITSWEGAEAIFSFADSPMGMAVCFWIMTAMLIVPLVVSYRAEERAEIEHP